MQLCEAGYSLEEGSCVACDTGSFVTVTTAGIVLSVVLAVSALLTAYAVAKLGCNVRA